jgi:hypothetical protein
VNRRAIGGAKRSDDRKRVWTQQSLECVGRNLSHGGRALGSRQVLHERKQGTEFVMLAGRSHQQITRPRQRGDASSQRTGAAGFIRNLVIAITRFGTRQQHRAGSRWDERHNHYVLGSQ